MILCDDGHDQVCFEYGDCPVCVLITDFIQLEKDKDREIRELQETIDDLTKPEDK